METLKDIANDIGYDNVKRYLFPSHPLELPNFDDDGDVVTDHIKNRVNLAVNNEHIARLYKNHTCEYYDDMNQPIDFVQLLRGRKKGSCLHRLSGGLVKPKEFNMS